MLQKKKTPLGIKIISIVYLIGAVTSIALAILFFLKNSVVTTAFPGYDQLEPKAFIFGGVLFLLLSIFATIISVGLWKRWRWTRWTIIILHSLGILMVILDLILFNTQGQSTTIFLTREIIGIAVNTTILLYLLLSKKVKLAFSKALSKSSVYNSYL